MAKTSFGSWAFAFGPFATNPYPFEKVLQYASETGFDAIEINGFRPHPHADDFDTAEGWKPLKSMIHDKYGLEISAIAGDFRCAPPSQVSKDIYMKEFRKSLEMCKHLGTSITRVDTIAPPNALTPDEYKERFDNLIENWSAAAELAREYDVTIAWEFEPILWINKPSEILKVLKTIDHPNFTVMFDTAHAHMVAVVGRHQTGEKETHPGGIIGFAKDLGDYIGHWHLIDCVEADQLADGNSIHSPFGTGAIDFVGFFSAMKERLENAPYWTFDFCSCPTTEEDGKDAIPFIKKVVAQVD
ncbi:sugar phosphate isomerase/epimerase family protein [Pseudohoeflea coraliihabitans]|uniref:Sugar phosphate isomerase/epimerase n=1 Tax=Pseudohoeflea coraliihabitans TaxID=2860393 RepID=A0ABS6WJ78_9HYPH|nr:sugar phosphate isomerase/epimerase family protein [Pseudohoeflea sp. DP4N28-3]MBW3095998.1 sugar phosphate isomerase/epimerase [Pseudohoeflea sp. DP4N28-3]